MYNHKTNIMKQILILVLALALVQSCRTKERDRGGKGGGATLTIRPQHHGVSKNLINFKVYIKYDASELPSANAFDDSVACTSSDSIVSGSFSSLKNGNYYIYGKGFDTSVLQDVKGGIPYTVNTQSAQNMTLAVSE